MAARNLRILFTSAGRRVELLRCFRAAAEALGISLGIIATDVSPGLSAACHEADEALRTPNSIDPDFGKSVLDICRRGGVCLVVPTIDHDLLPLSRMRASFDEVGTELAVSSPAVVEIARDKLKSAEFLTAHGIRAPATARLGEAVETRWAWPVLAKPQHGSASRAIQRIDCAERLRELRADEPFVIQEMLKAPEFTVNMFFDRTGKLISAVPHERLQVRAGEVEKGITRRRADLIEIARKMASALPGPRGALCFQAMTAADGAPSVIEINTRFGGGYPLADRAGAPFARWLLEEALGRTVTASDDWKEGVLMLRYDAAVFLSA